MSKTNSEKTDGIQSVELAFHILETLAASQDHLGVTELAERLGMTKSRIHRHLRTLVAKGYIVQSSLTERYRIGPRMIALGQAAARSADLSAVAVVPMRNLRDTTGHAAVIGQVEEDGIRILNTIPGRMNVDVGVRPGSVMTLPSSAQGKVALAMMPEARREAVLAAPIPALTPHSITDPDRMRAHLDEIRARGWATAPDEAMIGLNALACPVMDADGTPVGTIAIVGLPHTILTPPDPAQIEAVRLAAQQVSAAMGFRGHLPGSQGAD